MTADANSPGGSAGPVSAEFFAVRLRPGDDLRTSLEDFRAEHGLTAAAIVTCAGSLSEAQLRLAGKDRASTYRGDMEIVSLTGTLGPDGCHLHIAVSDSEGRTYGGHVLQGCVVRTTAEIVLTNLTSVVFEREMDPQTGYKELSISRRE